MLLRYLKSLIYNSFAELRENRKKMKHIITLAILITFPFQIGKGNKSVLQTYDIKSSIVIRIQEKVCFVVQLLNGFTEKGIYSETLSIKKNKQEITRINLPSSEEIKNINVNIRKYRTGFILEAFYGGGNNLYNRRFYFKCAKSSLYLYKIVGKHIAPNSNKKIVEIKNIQPRIDIKDFKILSYLENT